MPVAYLESGCSVNYNNKILQVLPKNAGAHLKLGARKKPKGKKNAKLQDTETKKPGVESLRKDILHVTK